MQSTISKSNKVLRILGTRGIPANHGGFETFAEHLALFLVQRGWQVTVYCQDDGAGRVHEETWRGVRLVHIPVATGGVAGTIVFDWKSTLHASKEAGLVLTLGYNTAIFCGWYRLKGLTNLINMDGIEWRRQKWGTMAKAWFYLNEWAGALLGDHLVADHPAIKSHLSTRVGHDKITTIAYGAPQITDGDPNVLSQHGLEPDAYAIVIARAEPENSLLEIVRAWSSKKRGMKLVVLGKYDDSHQYQRMVKEAASDEVYFPGAIYDSKVVTSLRFFAKLYVHGHQVGGTNPSLVEALGAGNAVLAHDNPFNRWVAGDGGCYFRNERECADILDQVLQNDAAIAALGAASAKRHAEAFTWPAILSDYEGMLLRYVEVDNRVPATGPAESGAFSHAAGAVNSSLSEIESTLHALQPVTGVIGRMQVDEELRQAMHTLDGVIASLRQVSDKANHQVERSHQTLPQLESVRTRLLAIIKQAQEPAGDLGSELYHGQPHTAAD